MSPLRWQGDARAGAVVVAALLEARGASDRARDLEGALAAGLGEARRAWPWYTPGAELWPIVAAYLEAEDGPRDLARLRWADAALLDAFRRGREPAAAVLVESVMPALRRRVAAVFGVGERDGALEDICQAVLCRILDRERPLGYSGRGSLAGWLARWVQRDMIKAARRPAAAGVDLEDLLGRELAEIPSALVAQPADPALRYLPYLQDALHRACQALPLEDRRILRYVHVGQLSAAQAGAVLGLHRVTVQRRIQSLRRGLRKAVARALRESWGFGTTELATLGELMARELDPHLSKALASESQVT